MQLVLNELSADFPLKNEYEGKQVMEEFLETYSMARKILKNDSVILDTDYNGIYLAPGYNIGKWRNDASVDEKQKRLFRSLLNKSLVYETVTGKDENVTVDGRTAVGALYAYLNDDCLISFSRDSRWLTDTLDAVYKRMDEDTERQIRIPNVANQDTVHSFQNKYSSSLLADSLEAITVGQDILTNATELFPNLVFCDTAKRQLKQEKNPVLIKQISKRLLELQKYFETEPKVFDQNILNHATPESPATLIQYKREHTFQLPTGEYEVFSWHMRFTGKFEGRIFFLPDLSNAQCYIGHIGGKLKTVTYG